MNRRGFIRAGLASAVGLVFGGCKIAGYNLDVYDPNTIEAQRVDIYSDYTLTEDQTNKYYVIHANACLDLGGFTLNGQSEKGIARIAFTLLESGASIKNGTIKNYYNGGDIRNGLEAGYLDALKGVTKDKAKQVGTLYRAQSNSGQVIENIKTENLIMHGFYITAFTTQTSVRNCEMKDTGLMNIYCDHGSGYHTITDNTFDHAGYNHITGRECIALDACVDVAVVDNIFKGGADGGYINAYTNWGENGITREVTRGHRIVGNYFEDNWRAISLASRHHRQAAGYKGPDYAEDCYVANNTFEGIGQRIEDLGTGNSVWL